MKRRRNQLIVIAVACVCLLAAVFGIRKTASPSKAIPSDPSRQNMASCAETSSPPATPAAIAAAPLVQADGDGTSKERDGVQTANDQPDSETIRIASPDRQADREIIRQILATRKAELKSSENDPGPNPTAQDWREARRQWPASERWKYLRSRPGREYKSPSARSE